MGSNFIRYVLANAPEVEVVNYDALTYAGNPLPDKSHSYNLIDLEGNQRYKFINGDVCDSEKLDSAMKGTDVVVHFAAETHVDNALHTPEIFVHTNVLGTKRLLAAARKNGVKRFHYISTDEVYGSANTEGAYTEETALNPSNVYSASKASAELLCKAYNKTFNLPVTVTRSANNFGPYQFPEKVIPLFVTNLFEGKKVPLYGDGLHRRNWLFVEDHSRAVWTVVEKGTEGETYNISADNEMPNVELTRHLLRETGRDESHIQHVPDRPAHDRRYSVSAEKINALGWKPRHDFATALKETVQWYKENKEWWERLKYKAPLIAGR